MKRVLPILLIAACAGREPVTEDPPGSAFGREPAPGTVDTRAVPWGSADGMPMSLRAKFTPRALPVHVATDENAAVDTMGVELGAEDAAFLGDELSAMLSNGRLLADVEADAGLFVVWRSTEGSPEAVLAAWSPATRRLQWVADLAWSQESDDVRSAHDSWIVDLDTDGLPELVQRSRALHPESGSTESTWSAWSMGSSLDWIDRPLSAGDQNRLAGVDGRNAGILRGGGAPP